MFDEMLPDSSTCGDEALSLTGRGYKQQRYLHFVRDAVYAVAKALHTLRNEVCGDTTGICNDMEHLNETRFIEVLREVTFLGNSSLAMVH